jgi:hypothetical protein
MHMFVVSPCVSAPLLWNYQGDPGGDETHRRNEEHVNLETYLSAQIVVYCRASFIKYGARCVQF